MRRHTLHSPQRGMSLVELLVATVISLLGVLIIFQVFAVNEDVRRTTTSGSDEQTSGLMALMSLERDLRHAGFGINDFALVGCNMKMYDAMRSPTNMPDFPLAPVEIVSNAGTVPDVIRVIYGGSKQTTAAVQLGSDMETAPTPCQLVSRFGFDPGDVVVVGQPGANCTMMRGDRLVRPGRPGARPGPAYVIPQTGQSRIPRFNDPAGLPELYKFLLGAKVLNLGPNPVRDEITVRNDEANPTRQQSTGRAEHLGTDREPRAGRRADRPPQGRVRHGRRQEQRHGRPRRLQGRRRHGGQLHRRRARTRASRWSGRGCAACAWPSSRAASRRTDRAAATPRPTTAPISRRHYPVRWARGPDAPKGRPIDVRTTADWQCYRYRVYETTVPLRNMIWRQE